MSKENLKRLAAFGIAIAAAWPLIAGYTRFIKPSLSYLEALVLAVKVSIRYFEVWASVAILIVCITVAFGRKSEAFLSRHATISAVSSYVFLMFVISPVYNSVLRPKFEPYLSGSFLFWWVVFSDHGGLRYRDALTWLCLPAVYCVLTFAGGELMAFVPYGEYGLNTRSSTWQDILISCLTSLSVVCLYFYIAGMIIIFLDRAISRIEFQT